MPSSVDSAKHAIAIGVLTPGQVAQAWPEIKPFVEQAVARSEGRWTVETMRESLLDGTILSWAAVQAGKIVAAMGTWINDYADLRTCEIVFASADDVAAVYRPTMAVLESYAAGQGCRKVEITGRKGWARLLADGGYRQAYVVLEKELTRHVD